MQPRKTTPTPELLSITDLQDRYGISRNKAYRFLNAPQGDPLRLDGVKMGRRTMVIGESVQRLVANLPKYAA